MDKLIEDKGENDKPKHSRWITTKHKKEAMMDNLTFQVTWSVERNSIGDWDLLRREVKARSSEHAVFLVARDLGPEANFEDVVRLA